MASHLLTGPFLVLDLLLQGTFAALSIVPLATHLLRDLLELLVQRRALWERKMDTLSAWRPEGGGEHLPIFKHHF